MDDRKNNSNGEKVIVSLEADKRILFIYGNMNIAVFYSNIRFWCKKNEADKSKIHRHKDSKGVVRYWTYNSRKSYSELFPFWTDKQIRNCISKLKEDRFLLVDNFNKNSYDRTLWYTVDDDAVDAAN